MRIARKHIQSESSEGHPDDGGDGHWIFLKPGWQDKSNPRCHQIHEDTRKECMRAEIEPCDCVDCVKV